VQGEATRGLALLAFRRPKPVPLEPLDVESD
jgi:hypothetical protein